jgi:hypothetical protein
VTHFVGHFPGFEEAKRKANLRAHQAARTPAYAQAAVPTTTGSPSSQSVTFDGPSESDASGIPPNPGVAAGPDYLVVLINSLIAIYDKSGVQQGGFNDLLAFFSSLGVTGGIYDPRVIYDQNDNRFIMTFTNVDLSNPTFGNILIAVSQTSDPTGSWNKFVVSSKGQNAVDHAATFPDFPTLGLSQSAIYISDGQFELNSSCIQSGGCSFSDTWLRVIGLPELLSGNPNLNITTFTNVKTATGFTAFSIEPALTYGASSEEFLVAAEFSANPGTTLNIFAINTTGTPTLNAMNLTVPSPGFSIPGNGNEPNGIIETGDFRLLNAVASNGTLWCAQNSGNDQGSGALARWYAIGIPSLAGVALSQTGSFSGAGSAYFPAVAAKPNGDVVVSFTTSSTSQFASAAFTGRAAADAPGTMSGYAIYKLGTDTYIDFAFRWGDYNGASVDPDGNSVWTIVEYAGTPNPHFGTAIAQISAPPSLSVAPSSLDFGSVLVGDSSSAMTVTLTNISSGPDTINPISVGGTQATDFSVTSDQCSNATVPSGQSCTFSVVFKPSANSQEAGLLTIAASGAAGFVTVGLTGFGSMQAILSVSPPTLTFPPTIIGMASAAQMATVTNTGNITAESLSLVAGGTFTQTNNCPSSLAASASCRVAVVFRPVSVGSSSGAVGFQTPTISQNSNLILSAVGVAAAGVLFCPSSLSFPNQTVSTSSTAQPVILTNSGSNTLIIAGISASGDFSQSNNCAGSLAPLGSCVINVVFSPTAAGSRSGAITVNDDAPGGPQALALTGAGVTSSTSLMAVPAERASLRAGVLPTAPAEQKLSHVKAYAGRALQFERNTGQFNQSVEFIARAEAHTVAITRSGMMIGLPPGLSEPGRQRREVSRPQPGARSSAPRSNHEPRGPFVVRMALVGGNPTVHPLGSQELPGKVNYFIGNDPSRWHKSVPTYARVTLRSVYPGVDLVYYGDQRQLEYDFAVAPGVDPSAICLKFEGQSHLRVEKSGALVLGTPAGEVSFHKPVVYQLQVPTPHQSGIQNRQYRQGRYVLSASNEVRFEIGPYDKSRQLVIDPILSFSTYLAGTGGDAINGIAVDSSGNAYVTGMTFSQDFPVAAGAFQQTCGRGHQCIGPYLMNAFVSKLSADGSSLIYSTYLGGGLGNGAQGNAIAVDPAGNAYVAGFTQSPDFPVTSGAFQTQCKTIGSLCDSAFVIKLNASGSALVYSTYLGGTPLFESYETFGDQALAIGVDAQGNAYVGGSAGTLDFPTTSGAFQATITPPNGPDYTHGFLTKLNPSGSALVCSTFVGGTGSERVNGIALDVSGNVYVAGKTRSLDFPTTPGAVQQGPSGNPGDFFAGFITKFDPTGKVTYSTYYPGQGLYAITADPTGSAYIAGYSPVTGASSAAKVHPAGCAVLYSAPLPQIVYGAAPSAIAVDASGNAYVVGKPGGFSGGLRGPTINPVQTPTLGGAFVGEMNPTGTLFPFWTSLGGSGRDSANAIAVDSQGNIYVAGETESSDFPTTPGAFQPDCPACELGGGFITRISPGSPNGVVLTRSELTFAPFDLGGPYSYNPESGSVGLLNSLAVPLTISSVTLSGAAYSLPSPTTSDCTGTIAPGAGCTVRVLFKPTTQGAQTGTLTIADDGPGSPRTVTLNGFAGAPFTLTATPQFSGVLFAGTTSVNFTVSAPATPGVTSLPGGVYLSCGSGVTCTSKPVPINGQTTLTVTPIAGISSFTAGQVSFTLTGTYSGLTASLPLAFNVEDFSLYIPQTTATVKAGQTATYSLTVSPGGGFNYRVSLACTGAPALSTCTIFPPSVTLDGTNPARATVNVTTTAPSSSFRARRFSPPRWTLRLPRVFAAFVLLLALAVAIARRRRVWALAAVFTVVALWLACGGGGGGGGGGTHNPGTPAGTYTLTITGTSETLSHALNLTLKVNSG